VSSRASASDSPPIKPEKSVYRPVFELQFVVAEASGFGFDADVIVYSGPQLLLAAQVLLRGLDAYVPKKKLATAREVFQSVLRLLPAEVSP